MNAAQIVDAIHSARYTGEKHGLNNTRSLLDQLHIPHTPVPILHVAGTNGKGSVCAMAESASFRSSPVRTAARREASLAFFSISIVVIYAFPFPTKRVPILSPSTMS